MGRMRGFKGYLSTLVGGGCFFVESLGCVFREVVVIWRILEIFLGLSGKY